MAEFSQGDRIAYSAKFLKNTGQFTGSAGDRQGSYIGLAAGFPVTYCRVKWDDIEAVIAAGEGQYADPEYVADVRVNGSLVHKSAIAKVGSAAFACNDI